MNRGLDQKKTIYNQFIQMYYSFFDKIVEQLGTEYLEAQTALHQAYYFVVKEQLIYEFLNQANKNQFDIQSMLSNNSDSKLYKIIKTQFADLIAQTLISKFRYNPQESLLDENDSSITPFIFSLLFENTLQSQEKQKTGVFYTSHDEVNFMCKEALLQFLITNTRIPEAQLVSLFWKNLESLQSGFIMKDLIITATKYQP